MTRLERNNASREDVHICWKTFNEEFPAKMHKMLLLHHPDVISVGYWEADGNFGQYSNPPKTKWNIFTPDGRLEVRHPDAWAYMSKDTILPTVEESKNWHVSVHTKNGWNHVPTEIYRQSLEKKRALLAQLAEDACNMHTLLEKIAECEHGSDNPDHATALNLAKGMTEFLKEYFRRYHE